MLKRIKGFTLIELLIVVAIIAILAAIAVPNFLEAQVRSKVSRVKNDQRSLATAIESYYVDNNNYPAFSTSGNNAPGANAGDQFVKQIPTKTKGLLLMPTFRIKQNQNDLIGTLTTPVAYISSLFSDPFADTKGAIFAYSTTSDGGSGWIVWSYGPDTDENEGQKSATPKKGDTDCGGDIWVVTNGFVNDTFYSPNATQPQASMTLYATYDPSNGTTSDGDVYRIKQ